MGQPTSYRGLLHVRGLPPLILAATLSRLAERMLSLGLVLFALARFSSPTLAGWLTFAAFAPGLSASPIAGALLDRLGPTTAIRIDLCASALLISAMSIAGWSGLADPPVMFILATLFSFTSPLGASGIRALLPRLVPAAALDRANALDTAIRAAVDVLGPGLAGLAFASLGPEPTLLLVAAAYAGAALFLCQVERLPGLGDSHRTRLQQTIEGMAIVARQPTLHGLAISYSLYQAGWGALFVAVPVFVAAHSTPGAASSVTGFIWAATGLARRTRGLAVIPSGQDPDKLRTDIGQHGVPVSRQRTDAPASRPSIPGSACRPDILHPHPRIPHS